MVDRKSEIYYQKNANKGTSHNRNQLSSSIGTPTEAINIGSSSEFRNRKLKTGILINENSEFVRSNETQFSVSDNKHEFVRCDRTRDKIHQLNKLIPFPV